MALPSLHFYPLVVAVLFPATFALTYTIAVLLGHTEFDWPYISDTGTYPPESCIFSQLLNVGSLMLATVVYVRFKQVEEYYHLYWVDRRAARLNEAALYLGWISSLGVSLVANFQETSVFYVHMVAAFLAFGGGNLYLWAQVYASYKLDGFAHGKRMLWARASLAAVSSYSFLMTAVAGVVAVSQFTGKDKTKWLPSDPGWGMHVVSTVHEWIMALAFTAFIATCVPEFKKVTLDAPKLILRINNQDNEPIIVDNDDPSEVPADRASISNEETNVVVA